MDMEQKMEKSQKYVYIVVDLVVWWMDSFLSHVLNVEEKVTL